MEDGQDGIEGVKDMGNERPEVSPIAVRDSSHPRFLFKEHGYQCRRDGRFALVVTMRQQL